MTVELVQWPAERERRELLEQNKHPRLLLVDADADPPITVDPNEDWVRLPAEHADVQARVESLRRRSSAEPILDEGVLRTPKGWVSLPELEARIMAILLSRYGKVADRHSILEAGWPDGEPSRNVLDVHLHRLRRRIEPIDLRIRTVRKRGYVLEPST